MAFGFFSNKEEDYADIIYTNCIIHTMDSAMPQGEAVAAKNGLIMRVGTDEDMQDLVGDETEVFDLEGMHVYPGFIEANASPVLDAIDEDVCFVIDEDESIEEILGNLSTYISESFAELESRDFSDDDQDSPEIDTSDFDDDPEDFFSDADEAFAIPDVVFGYGFNSAILEDLELEERQQLLDEVDDETPILLLSEDGLTGWFNTVAFNIVAAAAEENGMEILTLPFMLAVLAPVDSYSFEASAFEVIHGYCREGFTTVFEGGAGAYISSIFEDLMMSLINEGNACLRFVNGTYICSETNPTYVESQLKNNRAKYQELDGLLMGGIVSAHVHDHNLSAEYLAEMMKSAGARSGRVLIEAESPEDVVFCRSAISAFREKAGGKLDIMLTHDEEPLECDTHFEYPLMPEAETPDEEIRIRTVLAAEKLGLSDVLGSVSEGKYADFTIFEEDPLEGSFAEGELADAAMTIIGGQIVYDSEDEPEGMWNLYTNQQML